MRVTSKGQVTIPVEIRHRFAIESETDVHFVEEDGKIVLRVEDGDLTPGERLVRHLAGRVKSGLTTDELMRLTRGEED